VEEGEEEGEEGDKKETGRIEKEGGGRNTHRDKGNTALVNQAVNDF
jgi:hypothetical protein